jgi:hypothetical protein
MLEPRTAEDVERQPDRLGSRFPRPQGLLVTFRCINASCRVQTFLGAFPVPLNACPVCLMVAGPASSTLETD